MKIVFDILNKFSNTFLILGFFDGVHAGHKELISMAVKDARQNNSQTILITFSQSPVTYFGNNPEYVATRKHSYELIEKLGVDFLYETDFENIANIKAEDYLKNTLVKSFSPYRIYTGFNYTFGYKKEGTSEMLYKMQNKYNYKYICVPEYKIENKTVSSTLIKEFLKHGDIKTANKFLQNPLVLTSTVIKGRQFGRTIGFPTANMEYPENIVKIPYGVYKAKIYDKNAVLNWGTRPTINGGTELIELHIPNFNEDLYNKTLTVEILNKIRDEQKFKSAELLKLQIQKDVKECLE